MLDCGRDPGWVKNAEADIYGLSMILGISEALSLNIRTTSPLGKMFVLTSFLFVFSMTTTQHISSNESFKLTDWHSYRPIFVRSKIRP